MAAARVAVVGASGWPADDHAKAFQALGARVVPLVGPDPRARPLAEVGGAEVLEALDQLTPWDHPQGPSSDDRQLEVDVVACGGRRLGRASRCTCGTGPARSLCSTSPRTGLLWSRPRSWSASRRGNSRWSECGELREPTERADGIPVTDGTQA